MSRRRIIAVFAVATLTGCATATEAETPASTAPTSTAAESTTTSSTTTTTTTSTTSTSTTTSTTSTTTTTTSTTVEPPPDPAFPATNAAFDALASRNAAVTLTVRRDGVPVLSRASGTTIEGAPATSDSPMVVASVSKLLTANMVARLDQAGLLDVDAPTPWDRLALTPHPAWGDVTPRELLNHISGMPVVRSSWFTGIGDCRAHLSALVAAPPRAHRGRWTYSNGNYCALGLLVEAVTGLPLADAAQSLLFDPIGVTGVHLTTDGPQPGDVGYALGTERLSRLGGAGTFFASTDDLTATIDAVTPSDREVMTWPGLIIDQYGWGHTGTVDGAKSCVWTLEGDRTVVATTVSGGSPSTGGDVCDRVVVAVAADLGIAAGDPDRTPP